MIAKLKKILPEKALALDMGVLFSGFTLQLLTQIGWLVLALRVLGPGGYGLFASLTAVTIALSSLVGLGSDQLLIRHAAGDAHTAAIDAHAAGQNGLLAVPVHDRDRAFAAGAVAAAG